MRVVPGSRRLIRYWDTSAADYQYKLVETREVTPAVEVTRRKGLLGLGSAETVTEYGEPRQYTPTIGSDDERWAERTAKHYGLMIENEAEAS